jgi:hypothetical protein
MNEKKLYIWQLAEFLYSRNKTMSAKELADHLNRNSILTEYDTHYKGERGTFNLIKQTFKWLDEELDLKDEASKIATVYVKQDGTHAWDT